MSECPRHALVTRAGKGVGEGRVEEGGGVRGCEVPMRSMRGYQAAVSVHVDTQSGTERVNWSWSSFAGGNIKAK